MVRINLKNDQQLSKIIDKFKNKYNQNSNDINKNNNFQKDKFLSNLFLQNNKISRVS